MPAWGLQLIIAVIPLITKLIEKLVPDKVHHKKDFKTKRKVIDGMENFRGRTIEEIAKMGNKKEGQKDGNQTGS